MTQEKPEWYIKADSELHIENNPVVIDRFDELFHHPPNLQSTINMEEEVIQEAVTHSLPCSKCFPNLNTFVKTHQRTEFKKL